MITIQSEVEKILTNFKKKVKMVQNDAIDETYCKLLPYFEEDLISNMRSIIISDLKYSEEKYSHNFVEIRKKILKENKQEIISDLDQDNINEIERLKKWIEELLNNK